jgi:hypothetical protein
VAFLGHRNLLGGGLRGRPACAAVVTDIGRVIHHHGLVINVSNRRIADVVLRGVVEKSATSGRDVGSAAERYIFPDRG